jgi:hypothetical protein
MMSIFFIAMLATAVFGIICITAAFASEKALSGRLVFIAAGLLLVFMPGRIAWIYLRRRWTTGQWMPSPEEQQRMRVEYAKNRRTGQTGLYTVGVLVLLAGACITLAVDYPQHPVVVWLAAATWSVFAVRSIRKMKRATKPPTTP